MCRDYCLGSRVEEGKEGEVEEEEKNKRTNRLNIIYILWFVENVIYVVVDWCSGINKWNNWRSDGAASSCSTVWYTALNDNKKSTWLLNMEAYLDNSPTMSIP